MKQRVITGIVLALIIAPIVYIGGIYFLILGILLSMVASYEMMDMFYKQRPTLKYHRFIMPVLTGIITTMVYLVNVSGYNQFWLIVVFLSCIIASIGSVVFVKGSHADDMLSCVMTLVYTGLIIGYVISIRYIGESSPIDLGHGNHNIIDHSIQTHLTGISLFAYLFLIVIATDIFAFFVGSKFGKRKLAPTVSPNKSIEGAIGGLIAGMIVGTAYSVLFKLVTFKDFKSGFIAIIVVMILSSIISFMVQLGDLVASKMKRSYDIKDFGYIFPGHGGVLDRFDSLIFAGAFFYILIQFIQLVILK